MPGLCDEPTATFILIAVKALLKGEVPHATILAMIADLEAIGEQREQDASLGQALLEPFLRTSQ